MIISTIRREAYIWAELGWKLINSIASVKSYSPRIENAPLFLPIVRKRFRFQFNYSLEQIYSANVLSLYAYEYDYLVAYKVTHKEFFGEFLHFVKFS